MTTARARPVTTPVAVAVGVGVLLAGVVWKATHTSTMAAQYLRWGYTDIVPLFHAERLDVGAVPYLDHAVEYPVLTGLQMWMAGTPARDGHSFLWWTAALLVVSVAVTVWLLAREVGPHRALVVAAAPTLLVSGAVNWDLPSLALATAGLVAHRRGRDGWAGAWLGLGTAAKLWPGLALVALVPAAWRLRGPRAGLLTAGAAGGAWLSVNLPVMVAAPRGWARFLELNRERGIDWDPLWAVASRTFEWQPATGTINLLSAAIVVLGAGAIMVATAEPTGAVPPCCPCSPCSWWPTRCGRHSSRSGCCRCSR